MSCFDTYIISKPTFTIEPIGGASPKFAHESKGSILLKKLGEKFSLTCPAQGHPIPSFRCVLVLFTKKCFGKIAVFSRTYRWSQTKIFPRYQSIAFGERNGKIPCIVLSCSRISTSSIQVGLASYICSQKYVSFYYVQYRAYRWG